jgi:hypothetical protein
VDGGRRARAKRLQRLVARERVAEQERVAEHLLFDHKPRRRVLVPAPVQELQDNNNSNNSSRRVKPSLALTLVISCDVLNEQVIIAVKSHPFLQVNMHTDSSHFHP